MENVLPGLLPRVDVQPETLAEDIEGFISPKVRMLLNLLVGKLPDDECYFEVGPMKGASLISACLDHKGATVYACDNFSENEDQEAARHFYKNLKVYEERLPKIKFFEEDCFSLPSVKPFEKPIGLFFYDGPLTEIEVSMAITEFAPFYANTCILVIDDWNGVHVQSGAWKGITNLRPRRLFFQELPARFNCDVDNWWNGLGVFYIER